MNYRTGLILANVWIAASYAVDSLQAKLFMSVIGLVYLGVGVAFKDES